MNILDEPVPYPSEVAAYDAQAAATKYRILAYGDSNTDCGQWPREKRWSAILEGLLGPQVQVVNAGIGGTSSSLGLFRWQRDAAPVRPHCVVINYVLNDSHIRHYECRSSYVVQCSADRMDLNLRTLITLSRQMGADVVLWTPPPVPRWPEAWRSPTHMEIQLALLEQYVGLIGRIAEELAVPLLDYWHTFAGLVNEYPGGYMNRPDGYHSNERSQPIIAQGIAGVVKPWVGSSPARC
jgi:lysophospholipase L1-like esterase